MEDILIKPGRRVGNSTRIADRLIQHLFTNGYCVVVDHHGSDEANKYLAKTIETRMRLEHRSIPITTVREGKHIIIKLLG